MALADWSSVADDNTTTLGINIAENCPAANMNNALRKAMADVAGGINVSLLGTFLASTTLAQARTALGVPEGSTSLTNFGNLTNAANKLPYMTGSDAWSTADLTSFARTLLATGGAGPFLALLLTPNSISSSSGYITIPIGSTNFKLQWMTGTAAANTTTAISYPTAFSSWSIALCNGGSTDAAAEENNPTVTSTSTTAASVSSARDTSVSVSIIAIGV